MNIVILYFCGTREIPIAQGFVSHTYNLKSKICLVELHSLILVVTEPVIEIDISSVVFEYEE